MENNDIAATGDKWVRIIRSLCRIFTIKEKMKPDDTVVELKFEVKNLLGYDTSADDAGVDKLVGVILHKPHVSNNRGTEESLNLVVNINKGEADTEIDRNMLSAILQSPGDFHSLSVIIEEVFFIMDFLKTSDTKLVGDIKDRPMNVLRDLNALKQDSYAASVIKHVSEHLTINNTDLDITDPDESLILKNIALNL